MVGDQRPGQTPGTGFFHDAAQTIHKTVSIPIALENNPSFNTADNDVVQCPGASILAFLGMTNCISWMKKNLTVNVKDVPFVPF